MMKSKSCGVFGLIGYPLGHTMSPFIQKELFALNEIDACYKCYEVSPQNLPQIKKNLDEFDGFNITIPHKQTIIQFLHDIDERSKLYNSVNTVKCDGKIWTGYNTDYIGFLKTLENASIPLEGSALLCGSGGVARTMAYECVIAGCSLTIAVREGSLQKAENLKNDILKNFPFATIYVALLNDVHERYDLLLNATPVGMFPNSNECVLTKIQIEKCANVFDSIYNPRDTIMLSIAKANGSKVAGGMLMLIFQAAAAQEIWFSANFRKSDLNDIIEKANNEMERSFK